MDTRSCQGGVYFTESQALIKIDQQLSKAYRKHMAPIVCHLKAIIQIEPAQSPLMIPVATLIVARLLRYARQAVARIRTQGARFERAVDGLSPRDRIESKIERTQYVS